MTRAPESPLAKAPQRAKRKPRKNGRRTLATAARPAGAPPPGQCDHLARTSQPPGLGLVCPTCGETAGMEERLVIVAELKLKGVNNRQIQFDLSRRWGMNHRTIRDYLARVMREWRAEGKALNANAEKGRIYDRLEALYLDCSTAAAQRGAKDAAAHRGIMRHVLRDQALMLGLHIERHELTGAGGAPLQPTTTPLEQATAALAARLAKVLADKHKGKTTT